MTDKKSSKTKAKPAKAELIRNRYDIEVNGANGGKPLEVAGVRGAVTRYTAELGASIVKSVRAGMPITFASHKHLVPQPVVGNWLMRGEQEPDHPIYGPFAAAVRQAQAEFVEEAIEGIKDAGLSDAKQWTALMTLLERVYPEYFKRPDSSNNINVNVGVAVGMVEQQLHELHKEGVIVYDGG